jgi:hypothetical protein
LEPPFSYLQRCLRSHVAFAKYFHANLTESEASWPHGAHSHSSPGTDDLQHGQFQPHWKIGVKLQEGHIPARILLSIGLVLDRESDSCIYRVFTCPLLYLRAHLRPRQLRGGLHWIRQAILFCWDALPSESLQTSHPAISAI